MFEAVRQLTDRKKPPNIYVKDVAAVPGWATYSVNMMNGIFMEI